METPIGQVKESFEDIEIFIEIRSGKMKFSKLNKLLNDLKQAAVSHLNTEAVNTTESNINVKINDKKTLSTVSTKFFI